MSPGQRPLKAKLIVPIVLTLSVVFLSGCLRDTIPEVQHSSVAATPVELKPPTTLGQTFRVTNNNLYRVDTQAIVNAGHEGTTICFHLKDSPASPEELLTIKLISGEGGTGLLTATFPPITDSAGKSYYFYLDVPDARASPLRLFVTQEDSYLEGTAYQNDNPLDGDLLFTAYSEELYTPGTVLNGFLARASQDKPFFVFYLSLLALVILALGFVLRWTPQRPDAE